VTSPAVFAPDPPPATSFNISANSTEESSSSFIKGIWDYFMGWYSNTNYLISASCITGGGCILGIILVRKIKILGLGIFLIAGLVWCVPVLIAIAIIAIIGALFFLCICAMSGATKSKEDENRV